MIDLAGAWESSIILGKGEKIVSSWKGNREISEEKMISGRTAKTTKVVNGALVLTNQRLIFLEGHGVFNPSYHQALSISLGKVEAISMGGLMIPFISIVDDAKTHIFHLQGVGKKQFEPFRKLIIEHCQKRREEIEVEKKKERVQIVLDFSALREYMEKGGLVLQKTKCPECGANIPLPDTGSQTKCKHCGSILHAQDIFEKIKALI